MPRVWTLYAFPRVLVSFACFDDFFTARLNRDSTLFKNKAASPFKKKKSDNN